MKTLTADRIAINHYRANAVSIVRNTPRRADLAFFHNNTWVNMGEPWLQGYWDGGFNCPIYTDVPNWLIDAFLDMYRAE